MHQTTAQRWAQRWKVARWQAERCDGDGRCARQILADDPESASFYHDGPAHIRGALKAALTDAKRVGRADDAPIDFSDAGQTVFIEFADGSALGVFDELHEAEPMRVTPLPDERMETIHPPTEDSVISALDQIHAQMRDAYRRGDVYAAQALAHQYSEIAVQSSYVAGD